MTVGFPVALPPPLSSLRRGRGGLPNGWLQKEGRVLMFVIVIMSVKGSGWPLAPPLFNNPIITGGIITGDSSAAAAAAAAVRLNASHIHTEKFIRENEWEHLSPGTVSPLLSSILYNPQNRLTLFIVSILLIKSPRSVHTVNVRWFLPTPPSCLNLCILCYVWCAVLNLLCLPLLLLLSVSHIHKHICSQLVILLWYCFFFFLQCLFIFLLFLV